MIREIGVVLVRWASDERKSSLLKGFHTKEEKALISYPFSRLENYGCFTVICRGIRCVGARPSAGPAFATGKWFRKCWRKLLLAVMYTKLSQTCAENPGSFGPFGWWVSWGFQPSTSCRASLWTLSRVDRKGTSPGCTDVTVIAPKKLGPVFKKSQDFVKIHRHFVKAYIAFIWWYDKKHIIHNICIHIMIYKFLILCVFKGFGAFITSMWSRDLVHLGNLGPRRWVLTESDDEQHRGWRRHLLPLITWPQREGSWVRKNQSYKN